MQIRYFATIRTITKENTLTWDQPGTTLGELLRTLSIRYGNRFRQWVLDGDELGQSIIVLVNGCDARHLEGVNTALHPDDIIAIFPLVAGG